MHAKAQLFNRKAASAKSKPDEVMGALGLKPGQSVADIGSGGGYFTLRFAEAVGQAGKVYAADTNCELLDFVGSSAREAGLGNVKTILISGDLALPEKIDLVFMRNLYHHLSDRVEYFRRLKDFLKPDGKLAVIEYLPGTGGRFSFRRLFGHSTPKRTIITEVEAAGYTLAADHGFLSEQSFLIFSPKS